MSSQKLKISGIRMVHFKLSPQTFPLNYWDSRMRASYFGLILGLVNTHLGCFFHFQGIPFSIVH